MRCAEIVDVVVLGGHSDGVHDQRVVALVMADGFAKGLRRGIRRMFVGEINTTHHVVALPDHPDFFWRLNEINRLRWIEILPGNTAWPAASLCGKRHVELAG